jgi:protoporphyrinogen oxidase
MLPPAADRRTSVPTADPTPAEPADAPAVVVIGAGPAGLTAAYTLAKRGVTCEILEADDVVGGISRTVERDGWRFDIGGHRFFTKVQPVEDLWFEILGPDEFLRRPRMSRILYRGKLYDYPLAPRNALANLGPWEAAKCVASYVWARVRPPEDTSSLEGFIASRFGWRLYRIFFKTYNEKVWGVPASELSADWGAQRIKNLSLVRAALDALTPKALKARRDRSRQVTSLIEEFNYPKYGPGQMWERCAELVTAAGSRLHLRHEVRRVRWEPGRGAVAVEAHGPGGAVTFPCTHVVSSMPISALVRAMDPVAPDEVRRAADDLRYRDFITVALVVPEEYSFPDNWIYIHDTGVKVGRIQNFGAWSPYLVKEGRTCLGLEYFVNEGDDLWSSPDESLIERARRELDRLGLADASKVEAGYVVRMPKAYPVYDDRYAANVSVLRAWLEEHTPNVFPVGRNGMHRYNNQDHSMYTAMLAVENIFGAAHDTWSVNVEDEYHEERRGAGTGRDAPVLPRAVLERAEAARRAG